MFRHQALQHLAVGFIYPAAETNHQDAFDLRVRGEERSDLADRNGGGSVDQAVIDASGDGRERNGLESVLAHQREAVAVALGKQFVFAVVPAVPHQAAGVWMTCFAGSRNPPGIVSLQQVGQPLSCGIRSLGKLAGMLRWMVL